MNSHDIALGTLEHDAVMRWRKAERQRLMAERLLLSADERRCHTEVIARHLSDALGSVQGRTVGVYWPFRGEPNLRAWMEQMHAQGARCALPVVIERHAPLVFRTWRPGAAMACGVWKIPVPADGVDVLPDIVVSPVVGFDPAGYRLGYGGGFYDRTLAAMARRPLVIGVGFAMSAITTIHPLPHDIPMQFIVTEHGCSPEQQQRA
ncbi:5-formyltetrahydrofolate cyclo-ligase [Methylibium sp.]|uniref:5-formyltetrahydrofolate cyclo-ligase n=1 Tax=Methylibium sp. TaxID=2067992 RepID=UPI003D120465